MAYGEHGVDNADDCVRLAGAWRSLDEVELGRGGLNDRRGLHDHSSLRCVELFDVFEDEIFAGYFVDVVGVGPEDAVVNGSVENDAQEGRVLEGHQSSRSTKHARQVGDYLFR